MLSSLQRLRLRPPRKELPIADWRLTIEREEQASLAAFSMGHHNRHCAFLTIVNWQSAIGNSSERARA
jgi:hypothetical protein